MRKKRKVTYRYRVGQLVQLSEAVKPRFTMRDGQSEPPFRAYGQIADQRGYCRDPDIPSEEHGPLYYVQFGESILAFTEWGLAPGPSEELIQACQETADEQES